MRGITTTFGLLALAGASYGQVSFTPQLLPNGGAYKTDFGMISGVSAADYDNDGDVDLFLPVGDTQLSKLFRNNGDGTFTDVAESVGLTDTGRARVSLFFDYNADGLLDLVVARDCHSLSCPLLETILLYEQTPEGHFVDVTAGSGLEGNKSLNAGTHASAFSAGDVDNDGWLDLVYTSWNGQIWLFHNNGDGTFTDVAEDSGLSFGLSFYWQPVLVDFTGDGYLDLFIGMDFLPDEMWINQGDGTFVDVAAEANCNVAWNGMGVSLGDVENDGDWDIYVTNISVESTGKYSTLYVNNSPSGNDLQFTESSIPLGTDASGWAWGNTFFDYDLDGDVDLAVTNGRTGGSWEQDPSRMYENTLGTIGQFSNVSDQAGFNDTFVGSTVISVDLDRDGDLDLVQTCTNDGGGIGNGIMRVLFSDAADVGSTDWLSVRPRMDGPNTRAIGTVVKAVTGGTTQMRLVTAGISMAGQEPAEAHFGLGGAGQVDKLIIEWPNGIVSVRSGVVGGQVLDIVAPACGADIDASGSVDSTDLNIVLAAFGTSAVGGDIDGDGTVGSTDLNAVLVAFGGCN